MHTIKRLSVATTVGMTLSLLATSNVFAYTFTKLADTSGEFSNFMVPGGPALNDSGTVAFRAFLKAGGQGIFTSNGAVTTTIADTNGPFSQFMFSPVINNEGTVGFWAGLKAGGEGIFSGNGGTTTTIADTNDSFSYFDPRVGINDSGTVVFTAGLKAGDQGIFTGNGGKTSTVVKIIDAPAFPTERLDINDGGTVVFNLFDGSLWNINSSTFAKIARGSFGFDPGINNSGTVAFRAGETIFTYSNGAIAPIADTSGAFSRFRFSPGINDVGSVAFMADLKTGGFGIFTGNDPVANKVIATGDSLFGEQVTRLYFFNQGLNNSGQIAFYAELTNGKQGFFRANPNSIKPSTSVPEPTSVLSLLALSALGATSIRRKQKLG